MSAYYNEIDPYAAEWLRNLIREGHIAPGDVDERSIEDVLPAELARYTQCHFFAGVGVWSYALRRAGWPDDRPVWTGSCPCQPFSAAGKGGGFDDERHLWAAWLHLIKWGKPTGVPILGEQVASKDGLTWLDLVSADLEAEDYACWPVDICAAGVGAPHIRQRLFFVAKRMDDPVGARLEGHAGYGNREREWSHETRSATETGTSCGVAITQRIRWRGRSNGSAKWPEGSLQAQRLCGTGGLADTKSDRAGRGSREDTGAQDVFDGQIKDGYPSPLHGLWRDADWLFCRDGKWRPVRSGTFPLAHGAPARVGRLRAYGNAINGEVATEFIRAAIDAGVLR